MNANPDIIDRNELLGIIKLLDTPVIRRSPVGSYLLDQVIYDIEHIPRATPCRNCGNCNYFDPNSWMRITPKRKVNMSEEQRAAAAQRLKAAKEANTDS